MDGGNFHERVSPHIVNIYYWKIKLFQTIESPNSGYKFV